MPLPTRIASLRLTSFTGLVFLSLIMGMRVQVANAEADVKMLGAVTAVDPALQSAFHVGDSFEF